MTSAESYYFGLQYIYHIKLHSDSTKISVTTAHKNIASYSHAAGVWSLTRIAASKADAVLMPKEMKNPYRKFQLRPASTVFEKRKNIPFDKFTISAGFLAEKRASVEWQNFPAVNKMKVIMKDKTIFTKIFDYKPSMNIHMGKFYPAHFYVCKMFIELETHGPKKILKPGDTVSWREVWELENKVKGIL